MRSSVFIEGIVSTDKLYPNKQGCPTQLLITKKEKRSAYHCKMVSLKNKSFHWSPNYHKEPECFSKLLHLSFSD